MSDSIERRRTAFHEAGHVVAGYLLGASLLEVVSIRGGEHHPGVTISTWNGPRVDETAGLRESRRGHEGPARFGLQPVPLFDPDILRRSAIEIMCALAGGEAEWLAGIYSGYRTEDEDVVWATERALDLIERAKPSTDELEHVEESERTETPNDEDRAYSSANGLTRNQLAAGHYIAWLRYTIADLVQSELVGSAIVAVAELLLRVEIASGQVVTELLDQLLGVERPEHEPIAAGANGELTIAARTTREEVEMSKTPPINANTKVAELMVCTRAIVRSEAGPCREGAIVHKADPRVLIARDVFQPLLERLD
jgi:hypothetical protein